ncbi:methyltransferase domain-containing protein [Streptomyces sp. NPDC088719]|uniref:methyltransferase domain-containing protein n=1 Tax=Streptomyces sp. NPDC088719 TaxID=3365872 RepID=UPI0037FF660C
MAFISTAACRSCGGSSLFPILDLGEQPLANSYACPSSWTEGHHHPLGLLGCAECSLVQLIGTVEPEALFDYYPYFSSYSTTMVKAMEELSERVVRELSLSGDSFTVEIASNDGYLLRSYQERGIPVLGIEPARNVAEAALRDGVPTLVAYFGRETAHQVVRRHGRADVVHANNVMAHVPDINGFTEGMAALLKEDGTAFVECPYLGDLVSGTAFDTVYHEHVLYYSLTSFDTLVRRHGLVVTDVERLSRHGGSLRYTLRHRGAPVAAAVKELLAEEERSGMHGHAYYQGFAERVESVTRKLFDLLSGLRAEGARIAAYGAAAKGTVLLNHTGVNTRMIEKVYDRNPHKQGRVMPGVGIPIADPEELVHDMPTHVLLLTWNLRDEIWEQQRAYRERGGRFILPLPEPVVL